MSWIKYFNRILLLVVTEYTLYVKIGHSKLVMETMKVGYAAPCY